MVTMFASLLGNCLLLILTIISCFHHLVDGNDDLQLDICPAWAQVEAFYQVEILLLSSANWCNERQQIQVSQILTKLLYDTFEDVPNLISATASLCPLPSQQEVRRNLIEPGHYDNNNQNKNKVIKYGTYSSSFLLEGNDTGSAVASLPATKRSLRSSVVFVYHGGMRCSFCLRDNLDLRRTLGETRPGTRPRIKRKRKRNTQRKECRQQWLSLKSNWRPQTSAFGGPPSSKSALAVVTVPGKVTNLRITFRIGPNNIDVTPWNKNTVLFVNYNSKKHLMLPLLPESEAQSKKRNLYLSGAVRIDENGDTQVILNVNLFQSILIENFQRDVTFLFEVIAPHPRMTTKFRKRLFEIDNFDVKGAQICSQGITSLGNKLKKKSTKRWSVEEDFEWRLSWYLTDRFRDAIEEDESNCFHDTLPTIYVNLFEKDSFEEAQPTCPAPP